MEQRTYKQPPLIRTDYTPSEIIGGENMHVLRKHLQISLQNNGEMPVAQLKKEIGTDARDWVSKALGALREHGYYPLKVNEGKVVWGVTLKSQVHSLFESGLWDLSGKSKAELQQMARDGYRDVRKQQGGYEKRDVPPERWETGFEDIAR